MQLQYVELRFRSQTLLLGPPSAMPNLPVEMRPTAQARQLLHGLRTVPQEVHKLRSFLSRSRISVADPRGLDDHEVVELAEQALERGGLRALILSNNPAAPKLTTGEASMSATSKPGPSILGKPAAVKPVGQWSLEDRVTEVIRRASKKVPGEGARALQAMLTPENIALMVTIVAVAAAANLTPAGWIADAGLAALAFYYGGMAAFEAMSDLVACFIITSGAKSERDLDEASQHLAEAVIGMGTVAIIAILHRTAKRGGAAEEAPKPKPVERTPSPTPAPKPVETAKPKTVEAAKPKSAAALEAERVSAGFDKLADKRQQMGLPVAGAATDGATLSRLEIGGKSFEGVNRGLQDPKTIMSLERVNAQTLTHAEADAVQKAVGAGAKGTARTAEMWVDRAPCGACGNSGGLRSLARNLGVDELIVHSPQGTTVFKPTR